MGGLSRRIGPAVYLAFFGLIAAVLLTIHAPLLWLPFYWDELGQFVPASLDLFQTGAWIPYTTVPNVHPPGVMAYLAAFWHITGYSVAATRVAMLLMASAGALFAFLLAIELGKGTPGLPAFTSLLFLLVSPLFVAQSMLAQLDMPAMVFTALALLLFLQDRMRSAALACVALVMTKETGLVLPAVLGALLLWERRWREAFFFTAPLVPLSVWLWALYKTTGHWFGNEAFAQYNLVYSLHPVRFVLALVRRFYYLFIGSGHWIGTVALLCIWRKTNVFRSRAWAAILIFAAAHILLISIFGGAVLERYLIPLLPLLYIAFATGFALMPKTPRLAATTGLALVLIVANFVNPLYPYPWENNLAFAQFVSLDQHAANFVQNQYPGATVATMFPIAGALRRPDFGYVAYPVKVLELENFNLRSLAALQSNPPEILITYSSTWDPAHLLANKYIEAVLLRYYDYRPQASATEIEELLHMLPVAEWRGGGQWVQVFESPGFRHGPIRVKLAGPQSREAAVLVENINLRKSRGAQ